MPPTASPFASARRVPVRPRLPCDGAFSPTMVSCAGSRQDSAVRPALFAEGGRGLRVGGEKSLQLRKGHVDGGDDPDHHAAARHRPVVLHETDMAAAWCPRAVRAPVGKAVAASAIPAASRRSCARRPPRTHRDSPEGIEGMPPAPKDCRMADGLLLPQLRTGGLARPFSPWTAATSWA